MGLMGKYWWHDEASGWWLHEDYAYYRARQARRQVETELERVREQLATCEKQFAACEKQLATCETQLATCQQQLATCQQQLRDDNALTDEEKKEEKEKEKNEKVDTVTMEDTIETGLRSLDGGGVSNGAAEPIADRG